MMKVILTKKKHVLETKKILFDAYFDSKKEAEKYISEKIKSKETFVAIIDGKVAGVISYKRDYSHYANFLSNLVVSKNHQRKGVALALLKKFVEISRKEQPKKQKYALSSTDITNKASIKLHKKAGFKNLGIIKELHFGKDEIMFGYNLFKK